MNISLALWASVLGDAIFEDVDFGNAQITWVDHDAWGNNGDNIIIPCGESRDEPLASVRWFMAVGGGGEVQDRINWNGDSTEDVKIVDSVVENGKGLGDFSDFTYDKDTGDLIIPPSFAFDGYADGELGLRQHLLFGFKCDADYGTEGNHNYGPEFHQVMFLDVPSEEDRIKVEQRYQGGYEFGENNKEEEIAECSTGYANREPEIEWVAYNEDGTVFKAIKQDKNWSKRIIDTHTNANKKVDLTLQFGGKVGTLGAEFDKKYFVCKASYQEAVNGDLEELSVTKRYPEEQVIRIEHPISKLDVVVNGNTVGNVAELIVSRDETTTVDCESDGYEIGAGEPQEIYSIDGSTVDGPIVKQFKKSATVTCSASLSNSNMEKTFTIIPKTIDIQMAVLDPTFRQGIDNQFLTVNLGTDVDMDKLDISILDEDGKPINVGQPEIKQVDEIDGVPQYVLVYQVPPKSQGKARHVQVGIKDNGGIQKQEEIVNEMKGRQDTGAISDTENVVCQFQKYGDAEAQAIKFWYNECSDENPGSFAPIAKADQDDYGTFSSTNNDKTVMRSIAEPTGGAYICCYDYGNDATPNSQSGLSELSCEASKMNNFVFSGKNHFCKAAYIEPSSGFPWWIILVLFLIILIVVAAIMWWRKKKNDEENDLEAGNVEKVQQIPDGQIDATQEFEDGKEDDGLLDNDDQQRNE